MTRSFAVFGLVLAVLCAGCGRDDSSVTITPGMLPGTYSVAYSHGTEKLILEQNGVFIQEYLPKAAGAPITNSGKWTFDSSSGKIDLIDALMFDTGEDQKRSSPHKTQWTLRVAATRSEVRILINRDLMLYYVRKQPR